MTQNIYDNPEFFAGYSNLQRSRQGLDGAPEWPTLREMLPDLNGRRVLDLGCGFGWFCRWAREAGAASVKGVDVSANMLERAKADTSDRAITYERADLESIEIAPGAYDLIYSSLTFHYLKDLRGLVAHIHAGLAAGGRLVFSAEHPLYTETGPDYLDEGPRTSDWLAKGVVKQHRTIATYLNLLVSTGFTVKRVEEWGPTREQIAAHPEWKVTARRPYFLLVSADC